MKRAFIKVRGIKLFYRDTEKGKTTMLCLHGKWGRGETWSDLISRYGKRYRILAPDQRGHGLSDKPIARYAPEDMADDMYAFIRRLGCGPVIVVGHSMGGRVGSFLAARHPEMVKALAILDIGAAGARQPAAIAPSKIVPHDELTQGWPTPFPTRDAALKFLQNRFVYPSNVQYFLDSLYETPAGYDFLFSRFAMTAIFKYCHRWFDILPQLRCPVLLVRATESVDLPRQVADKMRPLIKNCTYYEVSKSDHMVYADNPDKFYPRFDKFLRNL